MLLTDALAGYVLASQAENKSAKTIAMSQWHTTKFVEWLKLQNISPTLEGVTPQQFRAFLAHEQQRGLSPHSVHAHYKVISPLFRWAITEGLTENDPLQNVRPPKLPALLPKVLLFQHVEALLKVLRKNTTKMGRRSLLIVMTFLSCGLRANELCQLELGDIHLNAGFLVVREGKGGKQRMVPLRPMLTKHLWRYINQWREDFVPLSDHLFVNESGFPLRPQSVEKLVRRQLAKIGVKGGTHILRHTFASFYVQGGGDIKRLQMILGHSSVSVTEKYVHLSNRDVLPSNSPPPLDRLAL